MAELTLVEIISRAAVELGIAAPAAIFSASNALAIQELLTLSERELWELGRVRDWTALQKLFVINLASPTATTGNVTINSAIITGIPSTVGLTAGAMAVSGSGIPTAARLKTVDSGTQVTLDMIATASGTGVALTFAVDTYELPSDFDHYISHTWWDRTNHWMLVGPQSPQFDEWQRSGIVTTGPRRRWRQVGIPTIGANTGRTWRVWPPPTSADTPSALIFEYVSNGYVQHVGPPVTWGSTWTHDTDRPVLDSQAIILGTKWRFRQMHYLDYAAMQAEYVDYVSRLRARDGGLPDLALNRRTFPYLITTANVQDGFFPGPS